MKFYMLLITCVTIVASSEFSYKQKNAVLIHPLALVGIPFDYRFVELDYLHNFENNLTLLIRPQYYNGPSNLLQWDRNGEQWGASIECGVRRPFYLVEKKKWRMGLYPQTTFIGGYLYYYHKNTEHNVVLEDYKGYFAGFNFYGGFVLQARRLLIATDVGGKWNFYRPTGAPQILPTFNLAMGFMF